MEYVFRCYYYYCCYTIVLRLRLKLFLFLQEDQNRGKPNWEHLSDELHVLLTVEDSENRAQLKLQRAVEEVQKLLVPVSHFFYYYLWFLIIWRFVISRLGSKTFEFPLICFLIQMLCLINCYTIAARILTFSFFFLRKGMNVTKLLSISWNLNWQVWRLFVINIQK